MATKEDSTEQHAQPCPPQIATAREVRTLTEVLGEHRDKLEQLDRTAVHLFNAIEGQTPVINQHKAAVADSTRDFVKAVELLAGRIDKQERLTREHLRAMRSINKVSEQQVRATQALKRESIQLRRVMKERGKSGGKRGSQ